MLKIYKDDYFHICSGINSNMNWCQNYGGIKLNTKYHIVIQQYPYHSHAYYRILVNGAVFKGVENKSPKDYSSVYVYASNPWYTSFKNYGKLENFKRVKITKSGTLSSKFGQKCKKWLFAYIFGVLV